MACVMLRPKRRTMWEAKEAAGVKHGGWMPKTKREGDRIVERSAAEVAAAEEKEERETVVSTENDPPIIMCGELSATACTSCGFYGDWLCDYPMGRGKTCDLSLCEHCGREVGEDKHLCPLHFAEWNAKSGVTRVNPWPPRGSTR